MRVYGYECGKCGWEPSTVDELNGRCPRCHPRPVIELKNEDFAPLPADGSYFMEHTSTLVPSPPPKRMVVVDEVVMPGPPQICVLGTTECAGCRATIIGTEGSKCVECQSKDGGTEFIPKTRAVGRTTDEVAPKEPVLSEGQTEADVDQAQKQPLSAPSALTEVTLPPESGWKITHQVQEAPALPNLPADVAEGLDKRQARRVSRYMAEWNRRQKTESMSEAARLDNYLTDAWRRFDRAERSAAWKYTFRERLYGEPQKILEVPPPAPPAKHIEYRRHRSYHPALNRDGG